MLPDHLFITMTPETSSRLLFLCTGNYYRSRFAEVLFNARARAADLPWLACSRGLAIERGVANVGPVAVQVIERLRIHGIALEPPIRFPLQVQEADLHAANLIIALDEAEHRELLQQRYPLWPDRVEYWQVNDAHLMPVEDALEMIEREVGRVVERLARR